MDIIIKTFFILSIVAFLYLLFRLLKWIFTNKKRTILTLSLVGFYLILILINNLFFKKMEFIQSKVYTDLYIVKNPIRDKDSLKEIIKDMVIQKMNAEFIGNEGKYKYRFDIKEQTIVELDYNIKFFEYYKGGLLTEGTAWFINHKEDPGGFSSEYLSDYDDYVIANFAVDYCENDTINYKGILHYANKLEIRSDTLINLCK